MPIYRLPNQKKPTLERTILFSHIPKTGGTSISQTLLAMGFEQHYGPNRPIRDLHRLTPTHFDYEALDYLFAIENFSTSFAVVRHPEKRFISDYKWAMSKTNFMDGKPKGSTPPNINEWVNFVFEEYKKDHNFMANHIKPQHLFVGPKIRHVYKFEEGLDFIFENVLSKCGITLTGANPMKQGKFNSTSTVTLDTILTDESRHKIQSFYADDYIKFGYEHMDS